MPPALCEGVDIRARMTTCPWQEAHCDALRLELADTNIKVVSLNVGPIRTKIRENSRPYFEKYIKPLVPTSAFKTFYEQKLMVGRDEHPSDVFNFLHHRCLLYGSLSLDTSW